MEPQQPGRPEQPVPVPGWQPPGATSPQGQPGWPPQQQPPGYPPGYPAPPPRPGLVTGAAVVLIVLGALAGLLGILFLIVGATFGTLLTMPELQDQLGNLTEAAGGIFIVFGALFLADGVLQGVAGIFILSGRMWARIAGLIAGVLGALVSLLGVLPAEGGGGGLNFFFIAMLAAYVYVVWVLATAGGWFRR